MFCDYSLHHIVCLHITFVLHSVCAKLPNFLGTLYIWHLIPAKVTVLQYFCSHSTRGTNVLELISVLQRNSKLKKNLTAYHLKNGSLGNTPG